MDRRSRRISGGVVQRTEPLDNHLLATSDPDLPGATGRRQRVVRSLAAWAQTVKAGRRSSSRRRR